MALISKTYTFTAGSTIVASEHNTNLDILYNEINGNIDNANIKASAGIVDTKLAQITTAGKVSGAALTSLSSTPSGAGLLPAANQSPATNLALTSEAQGDIPYRNATIWASLAAGTSGQVLKTNGAAANPSWSNVLSSVLDYSTSASSSTSRQGSTLKVAFGSISITGSSSQAITNLAFTSSSSYFVVVSHATSSAQSSNCSSVNNSGSQCTIYNASGDTLSVNWLAIGV